MTGAGEEPEVATGRLNELSELSERRCTRCGAVGTHYLTCPALRLPSGYRFGDDTGRERRDRALNHQ